MQQRSSRKYQGEEFPLPQGKLQIPGFGKCCCHEVTKFFLCGILPFFCFYVIMVKQKNGSHSLCDPEME